MTIRTEYSGRRGGVPFPRASQCWSCYHSARRGVVRRGAAACNLTVAGMAPRRPSVTTWPCKVTGKRLEGVAGPPSRARHVSRTGAGGAASRG
jgi:hypothetical protein